MRAHLESEASHFAPALVGRGPAVGCGAEAPHDLADQVVLGAHIGPAASDRQAAQHGPVRSAPWGEAVRCRRHKASEVRNVQVMDGLIGADQF